MLAYEPLKKLGPPERGTRAEIRSLIVQMEKIIEGRKPTLKEMENAIEKVVKMYPKSKIPDGWEGKVLRISKHKIREVLVLLNREASPGYPWMIDYPTKGNFIDSNSDLIVDTVLARLKARIETPYELMKTMHPVELVKRGLCDPVRVFVKNEFHTLEKIEEGRMRLISNVTIIDEVIERLMYSIQNNDHQAACHSGQGTAVGWDISTDEGSKRSYGSVEKHLPTAADSDVSGWDMSVKEWGFEVEAEARRRMCGAERNSVWCDMNLKQFVCTSRSVYVVTDGTMFCCTMNGLQNSGKYLTSYSNSIQRNGLAVLMGCDWSISMGDDNVSTWVENAEEKAKEFGFRLKNYKRVDPDIGFEFCSHLFTRDGNIPLNPDKGFANLLSKKPDRGELEDFFLRVYRHIPELDKLIFKQVLHVCGYMDYVEEYVVPPPELVEW